MNTNIGGTLTGQYTSKGEITIPIPVGRVIEPIKGLLNKIKLLYRKTFIFDMQNLFSAPVE